MQKRLKAHELEPGFLVLGTGEIWLEVKEAEATSKTSTKVTYTNNTYEEVHYESEYSVNIPYSFLSAYEDINLRDLKKSAEEHFEKRQHLSQLEEELARAQKEEVGLRHRTALKLWTWASEEFGDYASAVLRLAASRDRVAKD